MDKFDDKKDTADLILQETLRSGPDEYIFHAENKFSLQNLPHAS